MRPRRRDIKRIDQHSLVLPCRRLIELIGLLEPGPRIVHVHVDVVLRSRLKVHAVEEILCVPFVVDNSEFRWIEKATGLETARRDEISEVLAADAVVELNIAGPK